MRRETHLDQLADKLQEARVAARGRAAALRLGGDGTSPTAISNTYATWVWSRRSVPCVSQTRSIRRSFRASSPTRRRSSSSRTPPGTSMPGGVLNVNELLGAFQAFFREHSEHWVERFEYREGGAAVALAGLPANASLNSGGRIEREYGLGRGRTDLLIVWPRAGASGVTWWSARYCTGVGTRRSRRV